MYDDNNRDHDKEQEKEIPQDELDVFYEEDFQEDDLLEEEIKQKASKRIYRILSILLMVTVVFAFTLPPLLNSWGFLRMLWADSLDREEVENLLAYFEKHYLYEDLFEQESYQQKKEALLERDSISRLRFHLFIKSITNSKGDSYTYFRDTERDFSTRDTEVKARNLDEHTYYIHFNKFDTNVAERVCEQLIHSKDYPVLVLDLRGNLGGNLLELLRIAEFFLPQGVEAFRLEGNAESQSFAIRANTTSYSFEEIYIFLDQHSASASEILALTMKLHLENVTLVGKKTGGKSVAQVQQKNVDNYTFSVVAHRWFVKDKSAEDLQEYLLEYQGVRLRSLEDYLRIVGVGK